MKLKALTLKDKDLFEEFLRAEEHELSVYSFANIYIWRSLFEIRWVILKDSLCVFFRDNFGLFLYLPPLGREVDSDVALKAFEIMDAKIVNKEVSRIENIEERDRAFYAGLGFSCRPKFSEYLCRRSDLAALKGNEFKSKRACCNYFTKHYKFDYLEFSPNHSEACLKLYEQWMRQRMQKNNDALYCGMLKDSLCCLKNLLKDYERLGLSGRLVFVDRALKGFTFGFDLNPRIFCVLYEVTDLKVKGLAQFMFRRFSEELKDCKYINIMDDSGLENLKQVKFSYRPARLISSYIAKRSPSDNS